MSDPTEYKPRVDIPIVTADNMQRIADIADAVRKSSPMLVMQRQPTVKFRRLPHGEGLPLPAYETARAAGMDLRAALDVKGVVPPGGRVVVGTGFAIEVPIGFEGQVRPRSGIALQHGVTVLNSPGTIDSDYRGELGVLLINHSAVPFIINRGDRIAQFVISPVSRARSVEAEVLDETERGEGGFGSTGT